VCRRGSIGQHSLLFQLNDDEPAVVAELVALITELKADGGVVEVRVSGPRTGCVLWARVDLTANHGARGRGRGR